MGMFIDYEFIAISALLSRIIQISIKFYRYGDSSLIDDIRRRCSVEAICVAAGRAPVLERIESNFMCLNQLLAR